MCSIMGYCSDGASLSLFKEGFDKTISRGPDDSRIVDTGRGLLGFHRLSIMGLEPSGMQPFELDGSYVVCNGEIYGFEKLKRELQEEGYSFRSESDCEVLLPLYREHGTDMFRMLDAEFALILYDAERKVFVAARDPISIRPVSYTHLSPSEFPLLYAHDHRLAACRRIDVLCVRLHGADSGLLTGDVYLVALLTHHHAAELQPVVQGHQAALKAQHDGERACDQQAGEHLAEIRQLLLLLRGAPGDGGPERRGDDGGHLCLLYTS